MSEQEKNGSVALFGGVGAAEESVASESTAQAESQAGPRSAARESKRIRKKAGLTHPGAEVEGRKRTGKKAKRDAEREEAQKSRFFRAREYKNIRKALVMAAVLVVVCVAATFLVLAFDPDFEVATSIVRDINIMLISTNATSIGLYVTAFIFLNDSLKTRANEDVTLREAVDNILQRYRKNMLFIAFSIIVTVALEVISNFTLGVGDATGQVGFEDTMVPLLSFRWFFFVFISACAIFLTFWTIMCSKDITHSDGLIAAEAQLNMIEHRERLIELYNRVLSDADAYNTLTAEERLAEGVEGRELLDNLADRKYSFGQACCISGVAENKSGGEGQDIVIKLGDREFSFREACCSSSVTKSEDEDGQSEQDIIIQLGKEVRFIETIISRICENNIDKSIMNNDFVFSSMRSGFKYLYARKDGSNQVDIREENRFLDHIKYQLLSTCRNDESPYDNDKVEEVFEKARLAYKFTVSDECDYSASIEEINSIDNKQHGYIRDYKDNTAAIIDEFFEGYEQLVGYRDALIHYSEYNGRDERSRRWKIRKKTSTDKKYKKMIAPIRWLYGGWNKLTASEAKKKSAEKRDIEVRRQAKERSDNRRILGYAKVMKRVLLDRFTSFVKINDISLGNSVFDKGWLNYSELSDSNFTHSSFRFSRIENAVLRRCDLSTGNFIQADASNSDFTGSNFNYSDMTGIDLTNSIIDGCQMNVIRLRDIRIDDYPGMNMLYNLVKGNNYYKYASQRYKDNPEKKNACMGKFYSFDSEFLLHREWIDKQRTIAMNDDGEYGERMNALRRCFALDEFIKNFKLYSSQPEENNKQESAAILVLAVDNELKDNQSSSLCREFHESLKFKDNAPGIFMGDGCSLIDRSYLILVDAMDEFISYHKYSKIGKHTFDFLPELRTMEAQMWRVIKKKGTRVKKIDDKKMKKLFEYAGKKLVAYGKAPSTDIFELGEEWQAMSEVKKSFKEIRERTVGRVCFNVAKLRFVSAEKVSIKDTDFSHVDMVASAFRQSDMSESVFYYTNADEAMFQRSNLNAIDAYRASFEGANFGEASLVSAVLIDCNLENANLNGAVLMNAKIIYSGDSDEKPYLSRLLEKGTVSGASCFDEVDHLREPRVNGFDYSDIDKDVITAYNAKDIDLTGALATGLSVINVNMARGRFVRADMKNSFLFNNFMHWSHFNDANLSSSVLIANSFNQSSFKGAQIARATVVACEFSNTNMSDSKLICASLNKCSFENANLSGCNLSGAIIANTSFTRCSFSKANLANVEFENVFFEEVDFSDCIGLSEAKFKNCMIRMEGERLPCSEPDMFINVSAEKCDVKLIQSGDCRYSSESVLSGTDY